MEHPEEPTMYYPPSLPLSPSEHHNVSMDNDFQAGLPSTRGVGTTYGTTSMVYRGQYIAPVVPPEPVPPPSNRMAETPVPLPRVKSPMAHLPYPEDIAAAAAAAAANTGDDKPQHSLPEGQQQSPFPMSTVAPLSPVVLAPALTFIQYPGTETRSHYDGHAGGRGVESDDLAENDEPHSSPSSQRRGRRGKKQPKKDVFLGCSFCRERKIACHPKNNGGKGRACR